MLAIIKRELRAYFVSPLIYVYMSGFMLILGFFFVSINLIGDPSMGNTNRFNISLGSISFLLFLLTPVLTMKLFADEKKMKTDQLLYTSPIRLTDIVLGKYFASVIVFLIGTAITLVFPIILKILSNPPLGEVFTAYLGFILVGCTYLAIGLFASCLTESQAIAAVIGLAGSLLMFIIEFVSRSVENVVLKTIFEWLSVGARFQDFAQGLIKLDNIIYYITFSAVFVFFSVWSLEKRRWSEG